MLGPSAVCFSGPPNTIFSENFLRNSWCALRCASRRLLESGRSKQTMAYMVWLEDMADKDDIREGKDFGLGVPQQNRAFHVKGSGALDWGMQNRLSRIFNPASGRTVMLAFDHGYFQGPTTGLERIDLSIVPLIPYADVLMCTRGPALGHPALLHQ